jgi:hypothetical protein
MMLNIDKNQILIKLKYLKSFKQEINHQIFQQMMRKNKINSNELFKTMVQIKC